ncbi:hypothetical protein QVD17_08481 [Tagetes erecta]|uniref:STICHEL DnaA-N-like alpha-beta domain-containing protein n=1 Tax=Tagetes erecta TaxID=13708 RepID=A0AAD8L4I5_TARER|nr:hypothetical protein QVD17_08481 [Tagetes erecta]
MESGVEPLTLMSQLATVITDILAGSYNFMKERPKRKFFRQQALSKEDMEKLRLTLKKLFEAEKQLRTIHHSPMGLNNGGRRDGSRKSNFEYGEIAGIQRNFLKNVGNSKMKERLYQQEIEEIWLEVLEINQINIIKEFLYHEGKMISLSFGAAPTVQLNFTSHVTKSKAEKFKIHILKALAVGDFISAKNQEDPIDMQCKDKLLLQIVIASSSAALKGITPKW